MKQARRSPEYPSTSAWKYITIDEYCSVNADDDLCNDRDSSQAIETDPLPETDPVDAA